MGSEENKSKGTGFDLLMFSEKGGKEEERKHPSEGWGGGGNRLRGEE